jgi:hypothetical protein
MLRPSSRTFIVLQATVVYFHYTEILYTHTRTQIQLLMVQIFLCILQTRVSLSFDESFLCHVRKYLPSKSTSVSKYLICEQLVILFRSNIVFEQSTSLIMPHSYVCHCEINCYYSLVCSSKMTALNERYRSITFYSKLQADGEI